MKRSKKGLVVIPSYNESKVIDDVIIQVVIAIGDKKYYDIDIVVIDDGSSVDTSIFVSKLPVMLISHPINLGSGAATRTGLTFAKRNGYDFAVTIDADGQHSTKDMMNIIETLNTSETDLLIGSRLLNSEGMPIIRVIGNKALNLATRTILGVRVTDSQSGMKGFSREALEKIEIRTNGFEFCSEIVWRAKQNKLNISETPIEAIYTDYSLNKGQSNINALRIIKNLLKQKMREV